MILIGQYDSPFVRRVGIALRIYGLAFEHRPWSTFSDADKIRPFNPLTRVPTLVRDDGIALVESHAILDYLDGEVGPARALYPPRPERALAMRIASIACHMADKAVSLFYEKRLHQAASEVWTERCRTQIEGALDLLERERGAQMSPFWFSDRQGHADIAVACAVRFLNEAHKGLVDMQRFPRIGADCAALEATPIFREIAQTFIPPA
jgi:glutathione S-transferase